MAYVGNKSIFDINRLAHMQLKMPYIFLEFTV